MKTITGSISGNDLKIAIVVARFNELVTNKLLNGAIDQLLQCGVLKDDITVIKVPGAFEIPRMTNIVSNSKKFDGVIALGAVVKGETKHFDYVCSQAANGIAESTRNSLAPVMFGILTTDNMDQALNRAGGKSGNKGSECAMDILEVIDVEKQFKVI
jgi:6,7-dimethyl-8-ribityllumazine synthase